MSRKRVPLEARDVKRILAALGFSFRSQKGSHEQWVREGTPFRKVTLDCPKAPFSHFLIDSMARQAGVSVAEFYAALDR
jgi:predicted RNA binding protein YcfA (HicA-like mRNA interferase family)